MNNLLGYTIVMSYAGQVSSTELTVYKDKEAVQDEALREIEHRMQNDHTTLQKEDLETYEIAKQDIMDGETAAVLPEHGDGFWEINIIPVYG